MCVAAPGEYHYHVVVVVIAIVIIVVVLVYVGKLKKNNQFELSKPRKRL